jgi:Reverse transcriptase (RNA-dependent DNA polymerase)
MILPHKHFRETKRLVTKIGPKKIADWLLTEGYYAEQYILPPCFSVDKFKLKRGPYFKVKKGKKRNDFYPTTSELINVSFPKSQLTDRTFGIVEAKIYHDIVWHIRKHWDKIVKHLFHKDNKISSYSFPIPISKKAESKLGTLRAGRLIYEFIEMAENDLVAEAHNFKYQIKTDVKNFYPIIYTHSIAWALHTKAMARADRFKFLRLGTILDKLVQNANDGCTNGLPIGPVTSDLISEIILTAVDKECSKELKSKRINCLGVRFKDDYRFLCNSKTDAERILKILQSQMRYFNLSLNEGKSELKELPEGLFRPWTSEFQKVSLRYVKSISYKRFEIALLTVLQIDQNNPDTGVIDKFLSELITKKYVLKLKLRGKEFQKTFSLLLLLKERRAKAFPQILAIIELLIEKVDDKLLRRSMLSSLRKIVEKKLSNSSDNQYDLIWLCYLVKSNGYFKIKWPKKINSEFIRSIKDNNQTYFNTDPDIVLFKKIGLPGTNKDLVRHLALFPRD